MRSKSLMKNIGYILYLSSKSILQSLDCKFVNYWRKNVHPSSLHVEFFFKNHLGSIQKVRLISTTRVAKTNQRTTISTLTTYTTRCNSHIVIVTTLVVVLLEMERVSTADIIIVVLSYIGDATTLLLRIVTVSCVEDAITADLSLWKKKKEEKKRLKLIKLTPEKSFIDLECKH